jgi:hypothetical protein
MRTLIASLVIWIFVVPVAVAVFLIFTFLATLVPNLYFVFTPLALVFATLSMVWGPFWFEMFSGGSFVLSSGNQQHTTSLQEKNHEKCLEDQVRQ